MAGEGIAEIGRRLREKDVAFDVVLKGLEYELLAHIRRIEMMEGEIATMGKVLERVGKQATLGELLSTVVHELKQPLAAMQIYAGIIADTTDPNDRNAVRVRKMERQMQRLGELIGQTLNFSRTSKEGFVPVAIVDVISEALSLFHAQLRGRNIQVETKFGKVPPLLADPGKLRQVFVNLLSNARDALDETKGIKKITIEVKNGPNTAEVVFADNGEGMTKEVAAKVFNEFFTTKPEGKGTGLGLPIVRKIIEEYNGSISFETEQGKGSTFHITIPLKG